jgi:asparagine N-glycosylation enzyme membrane subunit Stt3
VWILLYGVFANVVYAAHSTSWCAVVAFFIAFALVLLTAYLLRLRSDNSRTLRLF